MNFYFLSKEIKMRLNAFAEIFCTRRRTRFFFHFVREVNYNPFWQVSKLFLAILEFSHIINSVYHSYSSKSSIMGPDFTG